MSFKDMKNTAPYQLTCLDHQTYMATHIPSAWHVVPGWSLENNVFDFMHNCFLGTGRIFFASSIRLLLERGCFDYHDAERDSSTMFGFITMEIHRDFKRVKLLGSDL